MDKEELKQNVKYILSEISKGKKGSYEGKDLDMVQEIAYYYL